MQFENTNITGAQMNYYVRQGRLERSLALRALLRSGIGRIARVYRASTEHGRRAGTEACTR